MKLLSNKILILLICASFLSSCASLQKAAVYVGEVTGNDTLVKAAGDMTPQQEYFLGRSITAKVVTDKALVEKKNIQAYVNYIGQYLAYHSNRPDLFLGYRFAVIEDNSLSAMSAPGGFIIISKAMVELTKNEDELAAVLAHEVAHVSQRHAEKNIKNSNQISIGKTILKNLAKDPDNKDLKVFSDSIALGLDTSFNQDQEIAADREAINILNSAGYSPLALRQVLERMPLNTDLMSKHPQSKERLSIIKELAGNSGIEENIIRQTRFTANTGF